ncbi:hypothetical protein [Ruegeria sp. HKCCE4148]|uniref:hypothetical protein n=1 Tax=Ruegeria sp. HKCCE4148 TaxID=2794829 RepID=UPI001AE74D32|nr:hypothetical protein [Ruegeria sp. HKCCE4148]
MAIPLLGLLGVGAAMLGTHAAIKPEWERWQRRRTGREIDGLLADTDGPDEAARALVGAGLLSPDEFMARGFTEQNRLADFNNSVALQELRNAGAMDLQLQRQEWAGNQADLERGWQLMQQGNEFYSTGAFDPQAFTNALVTVESGGDYGALGKVADSGDRAYGKYQIMGANIGPWSAKYLGEEITPEQFLANPELQDKIYQGRMMDMVQQYGPVDAISMWHSGVGLEQAIKEKRHDGNLSTQEYTQKVWGNYLRNAGQNEALRQREAAVSGTLLEAQDAATPYVEQADTAQRVIDGVDESFRLGDAFLNDESSRLTAMEAEKAAKEAFFDWKKEVYGEAEPPPGVLRDLEKVFRTPGGMWENRELTRRAFALIRAENQKMAEYKSTRKLVEAGVISRDALRGMNGGRLTERERNQLLLGQAKRPPGTVAGAAPVQQGDPGMPFVPLPRPNAPGSDIQQYLDSLGR